MRTRAALAALLVATACSPSGGPMVTMDEFSIALEPDRPAPSATWTVRNVGTVDHEFTLIASDEPVDGLPTEDGLVQLHDLDVVTDQETLPAGESQDVDLDLEPGSYILICNIAGHYQSGMRAGLTL